MQQTKLSNQEFADKMTEMLSTKSMICSLQTQPRFATQSIPSRTFSYQAPVVSFARQIPNSIFHGSDFVDVLKLAEDEWRDNDEMAIVSDSDDIDRVVQLLQNGCINEVSARASLEMADNLLLYGARVLAYYFYKEVITYWQCGGDMKNQGTIRRALLQVAKMIMVGGEFSDEKLVDSNLSNDIFKFLMEKFECVEATSYYFCN